MKLSELFENVNIADESKDIEITSLCFDSREASCGSVFFCLRGVTDGHGYAESAYANGCRLFCAEKPLSLPDDAAVVIVSDTRKTLAECSSRFYGDPCGSLFTIGITGTKGKTSTSFMIKKILESSGRKVGLIGTLGVIFGYKTVKTPNTTPESLLIHRYCREMADSGIDTVIIEVSSQALKQYRTHGIKFDIGIFTNLSPDHIGKNEHADYGEYRECKKRLFSDCVTGFFNSDDGEFGYMTDGAECRVVTFGKGENADYRAVNEGFGMRNGVMTAEYECGGTFVTTNYPGQPGLYNSLCAFAVCDFMGVERYVIAQSLASVKVDGRCETITMPNGSTVIIDYAHNRLSADELFRTVSPYAEGRIFTVFGCGGGRSAERRNGMGSVISSFSDVAVITTDNPRNESIRKITRDIKKGIKKGSSCRIKTIYDRRKAIWYCIKKAKKKDIVLVIGKGHEDYMEIRNEKYHYSDRETVISLAEKLRGN